VVVVVVAVEQVVVAALHVVSIAAWVLASNWLAGTYR
jgi:hypothetical protein